MKITAEQARKIQKEMKEKQERERQEETDRLLKHGRKLAREHYIDDYDKAIEAAAKAEIPLYYVCFEIPNNLEGLLDGFLAEIGDEYTGRGFNVDVDDEGAISVSWGVAMETGSFTRKD